MKQNRNSLNRGAAIFTKGERGDTMYVTVEGRVRIQSRSSISPVVPATRRPESCFGAMAVVDQVDPTATALALPGVGFSVH